VSWIEARFVGTCIGDRVHDPDDPRDQRRFSFELHSARVFDPQCISEPAAEPCDSQDLEGALGPRDVAALRPKDYRQDCLSRVRFPTSEGSSDPDERTLFDVRISDWRLRHPAEVGGRGFGTMEGTLRARLTPASEPVPDSVPELEAEPQAGADSTEERLGASPEPEVVGQGEVSGESTSIDADLPRRSRRRPPRRPPGRFDAQRHNSRQRRAFALSGMLAIGAGLLFFCGAEAAGTWAAPVLLALLLRRLINHLFGPAASAAGAIRASFQSWFESPWHAWLGAALVALQGVALAGPLEALWRVGCRTPIREELLYIAAPVILAATVRRHWPLFISSLVWTGVMCAWCGELDGTCGALATPISAVGPSTPGARTDEAGRWPVMPNAVVPVPLAALGDSVASTAPGRAEPLEFAHSLGRSREPHSGDRAEGRPTEARGSDGPTAPGAALAGSVEPGGTAGVALAGANAPKGSGAAANGGWLATDLRLAPRDVRLISVEHANRRPGEFFAGDGRRRVYLPTDALFDATGTRVSQKGALQLARLAALLSLHPERRVMLEVHTDAGGSASTQRRDSELRAGAVRQWLLARGHLSGDQLRVRGAGSDRPLVPPDGSYLAQQPNRRIEVSLLDDAGD
jgi:outer membrane protein OmpA-like peptidoglycan-associated protein